MADNTGSSQFDGTSAFASAVARARQIAAKITPGAGDAQVQGIKRPLDDGASFGEPDTKKKSGDSTIGAQLRAIADNQGFSQNTEAARAAQEAAARINRQLGIQQDPNMQPQKPGPPFGVGGMVTTEEHRVPDKLVGLIIGKGGEQITRLQAESGCKVQIAADSGGMPERPCTLTGTPQSIMMCKQAMQQIIDRGSGPPPMGGEGRSMDSMGEGSTVVEMNIPGLKVGLIIGKGGETIRQLQERAQVKMVMIQDSNSPTAHDKPLRISGEPSKCQRAKEMVLELLAEKDNMPPRSGGFNEFGSPVGHGGQGGGMDIAVPRQGVGLVIGKGGDMIKKIQSETGAKVQFKPDDGQSPDRVCSVTGPQEKVQAAVHMIQDLLAKANIIGGQPVHGGNFGGGPMGPGPGNDMGRGGPGNGPFPPGPQGPRGPGPMGRGGFDPNFQDQTTFVVPADKCGLVIGKGGETIREINRQSGAHVELDRNPPPNPNEKMFCIRGNPGQIQHAIQLIQEKTGQQGMQHEQRMGHGPGGGPGGMMGGPGGPNGPPGGPGPQGGPGGPGPQGPGYDQYGGQFGQPNQPPQQQFGAPQGWNAYGNQYPQQQNMPTINPQTGQLDYSQAWIEYYRSQGMFHEANMVMQQVQSQAAAAAAQGGQPGQQ
ncbi:unnamed protein product [Candidula unifasciata]|uniref:K Homology domain-containing protein n=1 Tax=Candidula unifasciata TaxID=100452 RepID=A0A8S3ZJ33_9EUPU|nr:unnamed protein product [Candidula unifasciata]